MKRHSLSRTVHELAHSQELHKGLEFGVRAAAEVSKDVWERAGMDAASALLGYGTATAASKYFGMDAVTSIARNRGWRMASDGYDLFDESARKSQDLGRRIEILKDNK